MIKNMIGAAVGSSLSKSSPVTGGAAGAAVATAIPFVLSRMSIPAMIVLGVGGYYAKRYLDKRKGQDQTAEQNTVGASDKKAKNAKTKASNGDATRSGAVIDGAGTSPHSPAIAAI